MNVLICMKNVLKIFLIKSFILMPPQNVNLMYAKIVELDNFYRISNNYFKMHSVNFCEILQMKHNI